MSGFIRMVINEPGLLSRGTGGEAWAVGARRWAHIAGPLVRDAMKSKAPVSPTIGDHKGAGRFRNSLEYRTTSSPPVVRLEFGSPLPYAKYIRDGTRPHVIVPRRARALAFQTDAGQKIFATRVQHPGTRANAFARRAISPRLPELRASFSTVMHEAYGGAL